MTDADTTGPGPADLAAENAYLRARNEELAAMLEGRFEDLRLVSFLNGEFTFESPIIPLMVEAMAQMIRPDPDTEAANYTETRVSHATLGELVMTLQRVSGATPHEKRRDAEEQVEKAKARLILAVAGLREGADPDRVPCDGDPGVLRAHMRSVLDDIRPAVPDDAGRG